jgi:polysaccharide biosynthesis transport protein
MDKQPDYLPIVTKTNNKPYYPLQRNPSPEVEEEKWNLGWLVSVFRRRALLITGIALGTTMLGSGGLLWITMLTPPQYLGAFQLLVEPITAEEKQALSSTRAQGSDISAQQQINIEQSSLDYESQIRILSGPKLLEPVVNEVRQKYPDMTYEAFIKNFEIERITTLSLDKKVQGTKLIDVRYKDADPAKIKFVLDRLSQTYLNYSLKERQSPIRNSIQFIDGRLRPLRQRVDTLQRKIQALRLRYNIVDPDLQGRQLSETTSKLDAVEADNQTRLAEAQAKRDALVRQLKDASPQSILGETNYYQPLLGQYQQVEGQIALESARSTPNSPGLQALLEKRLRLQNLMEREASRIVKNAADSIAVVDARRQANSRVQTEMNQKIREFPAISRQYTDLQRELALATDSLNKFAARQEALQIDAAQQEVPWELTVPPRLQLDEQGQLVKVNSISKVQFLVLISVLALLLGVGVGFLVETTKDLLQTTDDIKRVTGLILLGAIPHFAPHSRVVSASATEAFRLLSKNLHLLSKTIAPVRSVMITSPEQGDGKSTIALQLAMTAAAMGRRVLLVDADLRYPRIHELLELPNHQGLSNLLRGEQNVRKVTQSPPFCENLTVLTAGQSPFDPGELFTTSLVEPLFQKLQAMFDLVIVDTPPILGIADSGFVAEQCDCLALVVRIGKTSRPSALAALEELKFSSTMVLGVIANDAPQMPFLAESYYNRPRKKLVGS